MHKHTRMCSHVPVRACAQVLNRAYPEEPFFVKEKRLASGKIFTKK